MPFLISEDQFNGMFNLVIEDGSFFKDYADEWEMIMVPELFGWNMWNRYMLNTDDPYMQDFEDKAKELLKHFFFLDYKTELEEFSSTVGGMQSKTENASKAIAKMYQKACRIYNKGADMYPDTFQYLKDTGLYPELPDKPSDIQKLNVFGI